MVCQFPANHFRPGADRLKRTRRRCGWLERQGSNRARKVVRVGPQIYLRPAPSHLASWSSPGILCQRPMRHDCLQFTGWVLEFSRNITIQTLMILTAVRFGRWMLDVGIS